MDEGRERHVVLAKAQEYVTRFKPSRKEKTENLLVVEKSCSNDFNSLQKRYVVAEFNLLDGD